MRKSFFEFSFHRPFTNSWFLLFIQIALASMSSKFFNSFIYENILQKLLLNISSFTVPSFSWKSYNRNLSFKHFTLIHDLNNFALIWNFQYIVFTHLYSWSSIKCSLEVSCFLKLTSHFLQLPFELSVEQFPFYKLFLTFINDIKHNIHHITKF